MLTCIEQQQVSPLDINTHIDPFRGLDYAFYPGEQVISALGIDAEQLAQFSRHWDQLCIDKYMADGGTYRLRRYGQCDYYAEDKAPNWLRHRPYVQSNDVNPLNGGIVRHFEPLEESFKQDPVLLGLVELLAEMFDARWGEKVNWRVRFHPYRILATAGGQGEPTPEGLHRDGVTYITSVMVKRHNVVGGKTTITDANRQFLDEFVLSQPLDVMAADDETTMHQVTGVNVDNDLVATAYRDVLVVAFTHPDQL
ncbi:2OG-Fe dioxygenase family protein [Thaumasiovibrio subtropicus]|uniref:2OG-Fe dioxygenase family protein n=1 Tax=Thaumasiovibrio subtropicus TaxID=1891207 RepID=UPI000B35504A|nr:2OG-Fe dioxygenase family protein [Thaumasiovibrio subtropicus]